VKSPSSLTQVGLSTAESAGRKEEAKEEDTKSNLKLTKLIFPQIRRN